MPLFHDQRLIHIHNPRCGGTTINRALLQCFEIPASHFSTKIISYHYLYGNHDLGGEKYELDHLTLPLIEDAVPSWILKSFCSFVVVRHPWDRFTSEYTRKVSTGCRRFINHKNMSFEEYCLKFLRICRNRFQRKLGFEGMTHFQSCHFLPQYFYTGFPHPGAILEPKIIRIDDINSELPKLVDPRFSARLENILNRKNQNSHRSNISEDVNNLIRVISPEVKGRVEDFYRRDYEILNFSFAS